jgi:type II secretion system protein C
VILKHQLKPILSIVLILLFFVLAAGIWLLNDNGPEYEAGTLLPENQPQMEKAPLEAGRTGTEQLPAPETENPPPAVSSEIKPALDFSHLRLIGVATDPSGPFAIILNEKIPKQGLFHTGDSVDGALILNIQTDKVILKHNDQLFTLALESVSSEEKDSDPPVPADEAPPMHVLSDRDQADIEKAWEETRDLMTQIEVSQNIENDAPKGVIVQKVAQGSIFEKIGFQPGDVVLQIDEIEISIEDDAMEIYNCLRTKESVQFTVRRNSQTLILDYSASNLPE